MGCGCGKKKKALVAEKLNLTASAPAKKPKRPAIWNGKPKEAGT